MIPLTNNIIASAGYTDKTIRIWEVDAYKEIQSLKEEFSVWSLLKLKNREIMVCGGDGKCVSFWSTKTFTKEHSVECCDCSSLNGLIELPNHHIAVSGGWSASIDIINTEHYQRIKQIECNDYIISRNIIGYPSSVHLLNNGTFIYSHDKCFCQISSTTYEMLFKYKMINEFGGYYAVISSENGKYIIANNKTKGISIFKVSFI